MPSLRRLVSGRRGEVVRQVVLLGAVYELYSWTRIQVRGAAGTAGRHAGQVVRLERRLGILREPGLQRAYTDLHHPVVLQAMNAYYGSVHFVVPVVVLIALWRHDRRRYRFWRNAFGGMLLLAIVGFARYPLAPPRLAPEHLSILDVAARYSLPGFRPGSDGADNLYAAMPSLHVGWSTWCCLATFAATTRRRWRGLATVYPFVTLLVVLVTANHYVLDAVGGLVCLAGGTAASWALARWGPSLRRRPSALAPPT